tara:strand:- start:126 stop:494 length:369 start_codon:yes stop_codon:yes gene_type:complete
MGLTKGIDGLAKTVKGEIDDTLSRTPHLSVQTITGPGAIDVVNTVTLLITTGTNDAFTLADGVTEGQLKIISMKTDGGDGIVTPDNFINGTRITFNDVEDTVTLIWQSTGWIAIARQNAIFS